MWTLLRLHKPSFLPSLGIDPEQSWPKYGRISFERVWARYDSTLEPVLKDITIELKPGQKVM